jgi:hypothetical protein
MASRSHEGHGLGADTFLSFDCKATLNGNAGNDIVSRTLTPRSTRPWSWPTAAPPVKVAAEKHAHGNAATPDRMR